MSAQHPLLGVIAILVHDGAALLVQRSKKPDAGLWGFPGGHVELGEPVAEAALRELREETGVIATAGPVLDVIDVIQRDADGQVTVHYALVALRVDYVSGVPVAADDALDAAWVALEDIRAERLKMSRGVLRLIDLAG
ncbi:MAG: NUDIX hydrolase [Rhodobacteraceae bacterium]|nr:NUDIX hydrolase [Paracoccaceae bacterium]